MLDKYFLALISPYTKIVRMNSLLGFFAMFWQVVGYYGHYVRSSLGGVVMALVMALLAVLTGAVLVGCWLGLRM